MGAPTTENTVLALTTLARVKQGLGLKDSDATRDAAISQFITEISAEFASRMKRWTKNARRQEVVPFSSGRKTIAVRGSPITKVYGVRLSETDDFTSATDLTVNSDYHLTQHLGLVHLHISGPAVVRGVTRYPVHPSNARIDYEGGLAVSTDALIENYPDLAAACEQQVIYLFQRAQKNALGSNSTVGSGGETTYVGKYDLLPTVQATLDRYRRGAL